MDDQQTWVEALNINPDLLSEWSSQAPELTPILVFCLERGLVDYGEYMRFAQSRFELPILQANFFQSAFDPAQLEQDKLTGDWQPWFFPVGRWENVTYIACVEPPQEPESPEVRYVLADPRAMREVFSGPGAEGSSEQHDGPPPVPGVESELPNGFAVSPAPFVLDLDNLTFNIGPETVVKTFAAGAAAEEEDPFARPAPSPTPAPAPVQKNAPKPELKIVPPVVAAPVRAQTPVVPVVPVVAQAPVAPAPVASPIPAPAPVPVYTPPPPSSFPRPEPLAIKKNPNPAKAEALQPDEAREIQNLFTSLRTRYSASLIMRFDGQNAQLFQWDSDLSPNADASKTTVNLSYPTFMRIVAKTTLPYHGYLVDSPAHHEFFLHLGLEHLPVCVTAVPVRFDNFLWGIVVAFGSEENQKMDSLNFALEMTERLMNTMGPAWSKTS